MTFLVFYIFKIYFAVSTASVLEQDVLVLQELVSLQLFIQQTAFITPHVKTPTKTTLRANSIQLFQQSQFSQLFITFPFFLKQKHLSKIK
tara:strand:+ start:844 stop:1113 length:270 start_codon:yes stop_codon:yes gene_type:complete